MALPDNETEMMAMRIREMGNSCRCENCLAVLLRALFIRFGTMTDPMKRYHLEYGFKNAGSREQMGILLENAGFSFHASSRKTEKSGEKFLLYYKNSSDMEDFLAYIGASGAAFEIMNAKIVKEFRNSVNRQVNCDTANIEKQLEASQKYIEAIRLLVRTGAISKLPENLQETAKLRLENEQLSLGELGNLCEPKVSKSGMRHRMEKLLEFSHTIAQTEEQKEP